MLKLAIFPVDHLKCINLFQTIITVTVAETARIMPATFGQYRGFKKYNAHMDIRKNLFYKYYAHRAVQRRG